MNLPRLGDVVFDRYHLVEELGSGGMGVVFGAHDRVLSRDVALKLLHPKMMVRPDARQRFTREAKLAASLTHGNAVKIFDFGAEGEHLFIAMERLRGADLDAKLVAEGRQSIATALAIGGAVADVLAAAHDKQLVHRDIKPGNIFLEAPGSRVVVLDFGMAYIAADEAGEDVGRITTDGLSGGTPAYMSPEQCGGADSTGASDIYSLGCVLFETLIGEPPFCEAHTTKYMIRHLYDTPTPLTDLRADVPRAFEELVARMLAKRPEDRPSTAAVRERLRAISSALDDPRERARDLAYLSTRAARAIPRTTPALPIPTPDSRSVLVIGERDDELRLGLAAVGVFAQFGTVTDLRDHDAVYFFDHDLESVALAIAAAGARPVLVGAGSLDIDRIKALLRLGVADVITRPRSAAQLAAKIRRLSPRRTTS